jgi:SNF2 family DNA or RNA helicase
MSNLKLYNYQQRIVEFCKKEPKAILSVGCGLGKTASVLHYINEAKPKSCIIIAPKFVANHVWKQECIKWGLHELHDKLVICWHYNKKKRLEIIREAYDNNKYLIVTRDNVGDISDMKLEFDLLVMDELTSYKNHYAGRSKAVYKINAKQRIGLTGTFITNSAIDIYGQLVAVGFGNNAPQKDINRGFYRWRATHFRDVLAGAGLKFQKWQNVTPLKDIIAPYKKNIFTLDSSDWLEVPEVSYIPHVIELSDPEMNEYLRLNTMLSVQLNDEVIAFTENQKFAKLQTLCNGFVYVDDVKTGLREVKRGEHSTKLDEVVEFVARAVSEGEQVLLFYAFIEEREWILEKLKKEHIKFADVKSKNAINKWNNRDIEVLLGHPASCGHGLNLHTSGARMMVWSSLTYDAELWSQGCARLIRQGQKRGVQIHSFIAKNTVEVKKYSSLQNKQELLQEFIDLTK